jgi:hypothetical protein
VPERTRPLGISLLSGLAALGCGIGAVVLIAVAGVVGEAPGGAALWVVGLLLVIESGATAYGLWTLRWWAWPLALLAWTGSGVGAVASLAGGSLSTDLVVAPLAIAYLLRPGIRSVFGTRVAAPSRSFVAAMTVLLALVAAAPVSAAAVADWRPTVPEGAGTTPVGQVDLAGLATPGPGTDDTTDEATVEAADCLDREHRPAGWLDLCWTVVRQPDGDAAGDYYRFEVRGTMGSDATDPGEASGSGIRWVVLRDRLLVPVVDGVSSAQPDGVTEGCEADAVDVLVPLGGSLPTLPCDGRTIGTSDLQSQTVTWTCEGCLLGAGRQEREIGMSEDVKVGEGVTPSWALYADFGD